MPKVSAAKVKAFVEKARMGKYKTPDNEPNYGGKPQVPQSQTISNSKADERNLEKGSTPAEEDARLMDKFGMDWQGIDKAERDVQDLDEGRDPSSVGNLTDAQRRRFTLNLAKRKK